LHKKNYLRNKMKIRLGDCLEEMRTMEDNSVDSIVTDPPYGLSFMGKKWDYDVPSVEIWKECLRVLKPGGHLLSFAGTRTQHRMAVNIEDAGFEIRDMIAWVYGSGFPKSHNIGKAIDKCNERSFDKCLEFTEYIISKKGNYSNSDLDKFLGLTNGAFHFFAKSMSNNAIPRKEHYLRLKKLLKLDDKWDWYIEEAEREVIGKQKKAMSGWNMDGTTKFKDRDITAPATEEAKKYDGWGTALKPALEPITVARKPFKGTVANNVLKWGTGGINIDGCRVGTKEKMNYSSSKKEGVTQFSTGTTEQNPQGRFPANIILDEEAGKMLDEQSGIKKSSKLGKNCKSTGGWSTGLKMKKTKTTNDYNDKGGASRFFYCAKASKAERLINGFNCVKLEEWQSKQNDTIEQREHTERVVSLVRVILGLVAPSLSIGGFGGRQTEAYPQNSISTIRMAISKITELKTWNLLTQQPTSDFIRDVLKKVMGGINLAEYAVSENELIKRIGIFQEKIGHSTEDVKNATYQSLLKIKEPDAWQDAHSHHPTHKPTKLMQYLVRLVTPKDGIVLDPFMGSGSTGIACKKEGFDFIGIELDKDYFKIAKARIEKFEFQHELFEK